MVTRVHTVAVTLSPLLGELMTQALATTLQLGPVAVLHTRRRLMARLRALAPDIVLFGLRPRETIVQAQALAEALPQTRILAFVAHGRLASLHISGRPPRPLNAVSLRGLAKALAPTLPDEDELYPPRI